jgi:hypothetical protein
MNEQLFFKVEKLAHGIRDELRKKGLVVPTDNGDGTISVDNYTIVKQRSGFYVIKNFCNDVVVDKINLPQTAALLANMLALGKWVDDELLQADRQYGYSLFEEMLAKRSIEKNAKNKNYDRLDLMCVKMSDAAMRKNRAKTSILNSFEKLRRLR